MKKTQAMPFAWIFALIIGGAILFLAIFFSGKLFETSSQQTEAELARSLDILINPLSSFQASISNRISMPEKIQVNFSCDKNADSNTISLRTARGKEPFSYVIKNKYIFADDFDSKELWVFSKPFEPAWKVDNLNYLVSKNYCFVNPSESIKREMSAFNSSFIQVVSDRAVCKDNAVDVCFSGVCDITVNYAEKTVKIKTSSLRFIDDSTMYGAIFGSKNYGCNLERLLKRMDFQADVFLQKADIIASRGCNEIAALKQEILGLKAAINRGDYGQIRDYGQRANEMNKISCSLY